MSSEIYSMANLIRNLASAQDDGLALVPAALRSHAVSGDLLSWLQYSFPDHFFMDGISASGQLLISQAMKETAHDTGGTYGPKNQWISNHDRLACLRHRQAIAVGNAFEVRRRNGYRPLSAALDSRVLTSDAPTSARRWATCCT